MTNASKGNQTHDRALIRFLLENRTFVNYISILMLIYAIWATIEVITNATGATWWAPETGIPVSEIFGDHHVAPVAFVITSIVAQIA